MTGASAALTIEDQPTNVNQPHQFMPRTLTVTCGTKVTITDNSRNVSHSWSSSRNVWDSGTLHFKGTYSYTFRSVGTFAFMCHFHPSYMSGSVTVSK